MGHREEFELDGGRLVFKKGEKNSFRMAYFVPQTADTFFPKTGVAVTW